MAATLVFNEPILVVEIVDRDILFQNQGPFTMQIGLNADFSEGHYLTTWESAVFGVGQQVWACCPTAKDGQGSTLFWSEMLGDTP
jgi:hypothetical protein